MGIIFPVSWLQQLPSFFPKTEHVPPPEQAGLLYQDEKVATHHLLLYVLPFHPGASFEAEPCHRTASSWKSSHPQIQGGFLGERKLFFFWETNDWVGTKPGQLEKTQCPKARNKEPPARSSGWDGPEFAPDWDFISPISWQTVDYWVPLSFMYKVLMKLTTVIIGSLACLSSSPRLLLDGRQGLPLSLYHQWSINILRKQNAE